MPFHEQRLIGRAEFDANVNICQECQTKLIPTLRRFVDALSSRSGDDDGDTALALPTFTAAVPGRKLSDFAENCWSCASIWNATSHDDNSIALGRVRLELWASRNAKINFLRSESEGGYDSRGQERALMEQDYLRHVHPKNPEYHSLLASTAVLYRYVSGKDDEKQTPTLEPVLECSNPAMEYFASITDSQAQERLLDMPNMARVNTVKTWIRDCDYPDDCTKMSRPEYGGTGDAFVPKRLLAIDDGPEPESITVRLVETAGNDLGRSRPRYATLSHCWGEKRFLTLTVENRGQFLERVPTHQLGKTFREALTLCWKLGIRHLWIDSLCIIQDSSGAADWEEEAPTMHQVYGNSYLNIAATASQRCSDGLWRAPRPALLSDVAIMLPDGSYLRRKGITKTWGGSAANMLGRSPLFGRGWCLQEFFLAPRTLHMADWQMRWICQRRILAELGDDVHPSNHPGSMRREPDNLDALWERVKRTYSRTRVTQARDRYAALAGLAAWFAKEYEGKRVSATYLAGCWEHSLRTELLWSKSDTDGEQDRETMFEVPPPLTMPSWSWLGCGSIEYPYKKIPALMGTRSYAEFLLTLVHQSVIPYHPGNPYAGVTSGALYLKAPVCEIKLQSSSVMEGNVRNRVMGHDCLVSSLEGKSVFVPANTPGHGNPELLFYPDCDKVLNALNTGFPLIYAPVQHVSVSYGISEVIGLLMESVPKIEEQEGARAELARFEDLPTYKRIGMMLCTDLRHEVVTLPTDSTVDSEPLRPNQRPVRARCSPSCRLGEFFKKLSRTEPYSFCLV